MKTTRDIGIEFEYKKAISNTLGIEEQTEFLYKEWVEKEEVVKTLKEIKKNSVSRQLGVLFEKLDDLDEETKKAIKDIYCKLEDVDKDLDERIHKLVGK